MKKINKKPLILCAALLSVAFAGCKTEGGEEHIHIAETDWTGDQEFHWHEYRCCKYAYNEMTKDKAPHTWDGDYVLRDNASISKNESKSRTCLICSYEDVVVVEGTRIKSTATPLGDGFVKITGVHFNSDEYFNCNEVYYTEDYEIRDLIVCDHEVTRGEYKSLIGTDPSIANAYDKDGNKLTGDAVLNNPVNYVSWYDAIEYCNALSEKENLTPCYTINKETQDINNESDYDSLKWTVICNFDANGYRLPTDAEAQWLALGGETMLESADNKGLTDATYAWLHGNGTRDVKTKKENGYNLYDTIGNVDEWCWNWKPFSGVDFAFPEDQENQYGTSRLYFGGSFDSYSKASWLLWESRSPHNKYDHIGFRVVRTAK